MRDTRIVLLTKSEDSQKIRDAWQAAVNKRGKLDLSHCHIQTIDNKYTVCRWDWTMISSADRFDLINICERAEVGYQFLFIGRERLDDVENHICQGRVRLPVRLEPRTTVDLLEGEWVNPIGNPRKEEQ